MVYFIFPLAVADSSRLLSQVNLANIEYLPHVQNSVSGLFIYTELYLVTILGGQGWHITSIFLDYDMNKIRKAV